MQEFWRQTLVLQLIEQSTPICLHLEFTNISTFGHIIIDVICFNYFLYTQVKSIKIKLCES